MTEYDWQEMADEAAAARQIEHDQQQAGHVPEPVELPDDYFETEPF